jgi:hypothetical protein
VSMTCKTTPAHSVRERRYRAANADDRSLAMHRAPPPSALVGTDGSARTPVWAARAGMPERNRTTLAGNVGQLIRRSGSITKPSLNAQRS